MTKNIFHLSIIIGTFALIVNTLSAQNTHEELKARFSNLPEEQRAAYIKHANEASRLFSLKRIFETLDEIHLCEKILKDDPNIVNLKGACHVEFRNFEKAREIFLHANSLTENNINIQFNLAELQFVQHQWASCHEALKKIEPSIPDSTKGMHRLVLFKSLLCKIKLTEEKDISDERKQELEEEIQELSQRFDFRDDSPFHYYANASLAFREDDVIKADSWIGRARRIFSGNLLSSWQDTLIEAGYIQSFYGNNSAEPQ